MHIVVFGAGAVGGYFGGRLARAGEQVTFIARGDHLHAMRANGLRVDSINGNFTLKPVDVTDNPTSVKDVEAILVCVNSWQIPESAKAMLPMLGPRTIVVPLENGVEAYTLLTETLGSSHVLGGLCSIFCHIVAPGHIQHTGAVPFIALGEPDNCPTDVVEYFHLVLRNAGIDAEIPSDITLAVWQKFLMTAALSGIGSIARVPVGSYRSQPGLRKMFENVVQEGYTIGTAQGVNLPVDSVAKCLDSLDLIPPDTLTAMQRDIMDASPSELESQNGFIFHLGQQLNIPTPVNAFIYHCLLPQENSARGINP